MKDRSVRLAGTDQRGRQWGATIWGPYPQEGEGSSIPGSHAVSPGRA